MENETIAKVISVETGEVLDTLKAGDKIKHLSSSEFLNEYDVNFNKGVRFVKLFDEVLDVLSERLSVSEFRFAVRLAKHVSYDDCILVLEYNHRHEMLNRLYLSKRSSTQWQKIKNLIRQNISNKSLICTVRLAKV